MVGAGGLGRDAGRHSLTRPNDQLHALRKRIGKLKANRRWHLNSLACKTKSTRSLIKPEDDDVVGFLIRHQQKRSAWIDGKVAWRHAASGFVANRSEATAARIDCENSDAVVATVRTIDKSAIRGNMDVGTCVCPR